MSTKTRLGQIQLQWMIIYTSCTYYIVGLLTGHFPHRTLTLTIRHLLTSVLWSLWFKHGIPESAVWSSIVLILKHPLLVYSLVRAGSSWHFRQAGDTRIPLPRKLLGHPQKIIDCKVGLCTSLQTVAEFSITILCVSFRNSATVVRLEQV